MMKLNISRTTIENDPNWIPSIGADLTKLHWRKGKLHATCNPDDDTCIIHEDTHDPYDFPAGTVKHLWDWNKLGTIGLGILTVYALDKTFNDGKLTKKVKRELGI
jgi:hypothetical protein